ncbi:zinc-ribbon domain-containing protein [Archangium violaceum]|uniref:zinc-ribbon domain-containing protein n=1 Tax=Archangium violaceum TaxID=83451 RepID=UPI00193BE89A|nr:zinc-ribbon domain-containing protein [Archangium violaceum]QRK05957.1 zinc-ribbon domain-containing protein [Archangium violaceum]
MEIACPQCSMQYALDPRLLPPGGVPVQCTRCSHIFIAAPPGAAAPPPRPAAPRPTAPNPSPNPSLNSTLLYGDAGGAAQQHPIGTTQTFGAVPRIPSVAPVGPAGPRPQPAPAGAVPAPQTTQVFGAVPKPPPAARPPAGAVPAPQTTQVFGAVPQPRARPPSAATTPPFGSMPQQVAPVARPPAGTTAPAPQTTQVFGAVPAPQTTQVFGAVPEVPPRAQAPAMPPPGQPATGTFSQPPGLMPRAATEERLPEAPAPKPGPLVGVAATTPIELPDEILDQLNRPLSELIAEGASSPENPQSQAGGPVQALSKPLELPPALLDGSVDITPKEGRGKRPEPGRKGRNLLIAGGVLVLALTAFLTSPAWLTKSNAMPHEVRVARDEAVVLLRRDDAASKEEALSRLKALSAAHPQNVELLAEVASALGMHVDDTRVQVATLQAKVLRLQARISRLKLARSPADWQSRVNTMQEELTATQRELTPLDERAKVLSKEAVQVLKQLGAAPEKESREVALARLRGSAMLSSILGGGEALGMAVKLAQADLRDWSTVAMAEYVLNYATPTEPQIQESIAALERLREKDNTFLRAYVLGARIALTRKETAVAQSLLDAVITLNPKHELAQQLHSYAGELAKQESEPEPIPPAPSPEVELPPAVDPDATASSDAGAEATAPLAPSLEATPSP